MRYRLTAALLAATAALGAAVAVACTTAPPPQTGPVSMGGLGAFSATCSFSHRAPDDPIVYPSSPGAAHSHDFMGARSTDAFSTLASLRASDTTCIRHNTATGRTADTAAYWVPTLIINDEPVTPTVMTANYTTSPYRYMQAIRAFPDGLKIITGNPTGTAGEINGHRVWFWECGDTQIAAGNATTAPTCASVLTLYMGFPDCWDGVNLDSADHRSHMRYSSWPAPTYKPPYVCPPSHPFVMPQLTLRYRYPTQGGPTTRLSSGAINTAHADFFNAWREGAMAPLVTDCLNVDKYCGGGDKPA